MSLKTSEAHDPSPEEVQAARAKADAKRADAIAARIDAAKSTPPSASRSWDARDALDACERLFRDHPGSLIRERCRDEIFTHPKGVDDGSSSEHARDLVYGEFGFMSLVALFRKYSDQIPRRAVVADLGSGVGRPLFAAACLRPDIARCVGVEKLRGLHELAGELRALYDAELAPVLGAHPPRVELHRGDFLGGVEWRGADVVLVNSAIFRDELFHATEARAAEVLTPGALVVTLRRGFRDCGHEGACWELLEATERRQSWGMSTVYVHRRTRNSPRRTGIED